jgi:ferredoxin
MICLVEDVVSGRLLPACSAAVSQGMVVETRNERVTDARRGMLELLLREHVGDCESPCFRACPVQLDIPGILRRIIRGSADASYETQGYDIPLLAVLEQVCPAPCERACRRRLHDDALSIRLAMRFAVSHDLEAKPSPGPASTLSSGMKVAVVGAGPVGLSAVHHLTRYGHSCSIYDRGADPGGALRSEIPEKRLPRTLLDDAVNRIRDLGVSFHLGIEVGRDIALEELRGRFDAVVLAHGEAGPDDGFGAEMTQRGIRRDRRTFETSISGVFAGGSAVRPSRVAARAVAEGRSIADRVHQFLGHEELTVPRGEFDCRMGALKKDEIAELLKGVSERRRTHTSQRGSGGFSVDEAVQEAQRCLHCDCGGKNDCLLRRYAREYGAANQQSVAERIAYRRIVEHPQILFEPSKCIKCGRCVRIAEAAGETYGISFKGRSFSLNIAVPFDEPLALGLKKSALQCARACPTGAMTIKFEAFAAEISHG